MLCLNTQKKNENSFDNAAISTVACSKKPNTETKNNGKFIQETMIGSHFMYVINIACELHTLFILCSRLLFE